MVEESGKIGPLTPTEVFEAPEAPELAKWVSWAWHHTKANREAFMKPAVWMLALMVGLLAYHLGVDRSEEIVTIKDERIKQIAEQLVAYKDRLDGATPDEAAKRFSDLQTVVRQQKIKIDKIFPDTDRKISSSQEDFLISHGKEIKSDVKSFIFVYASSFGDAPLYANNFVEILRKSEIGVVGVIQTNCSRNENGLLIGIRDPDKPSMEAKSFIEILQDAKFEVHTTKWNDGSADANQDFDLFVCN